MFASRIAKAQSKTGEAATSKSSVQRSALPGLRAGRTPDTQARIFHGAIGNQATLRNSREQGSEENGRSGDQEREAPTEAMRFGRAPRGSSRDLSTIALSPPVPVNQPEACPTRGSQPAFLQAKLTIGSVDDPLEHEADAVAEQVMRMPDPQLSVTETPLRVSRKCAACEDEDRSVQRKGTDAPQVTEDTAPPLVHDVLRSAGQPFDPRTRAFFEARYGRDFANVRIHTETAAEQAASSVSARAFTVGDHIVFGSGAFEPASRAGRQLIAHELAHVVQQSSGAAFQRVGSIHGPIGPGHAAQAPGGDPVVRRKVILSGTEMDSKARHAFLKAHKWSSARRALAVMEDMAAAADLFDFSDEHELEAEINKRLSTVAHMEESQTSVEKIPGDKRSAFGYPFSGASALYGPRVNYAARKYWEPAVADNYAQRTDKAKNKKLQALPRHERCTVYGDQCGDYGWKLSPDGRKDPYHAIAFLFAPQPPHKRTLIHCDYLISLVNLMSLADSVGPAEFNKRIAAFGPDKLFLKWNAFTDLHAATLERTATGEFAKAATGGLIAKPGLRSTQRVRPSSEADLVIGDHVVFFNHIAYDLINQNVGNAWRLENAVLVSREKGKDVFLGHGSGYRTSEEMRIKLAKEFDEVAKKATEQTKRASSPHKAVRDAAQAELVSRFPNIKLVGGQWRIQGVPDLLKDSACPKSMDLPLRDDIKPAEVIGPRSPCDPTKMNEVERPIESAK